MKRLFLLFFSGLLSCSFSGLRDIPEVVCFPTQIDVREWTPVSQPVSGIAMTSHSERSLIEEYGVVRISSAEYIHVRENAKIKIEIWFTGNSLYSVSILRRSINGYIYDNSKDLFTADKSVIFSKGSYYVRIISDTAYASLKNEFIDAARFVSEKLPKAETLPTMTDIFSNRMTIYYPKERDEIFSLSNFYLTTVLIKDKKYECFYLARDSKDEINALFSGIMRDNTKSVLTDSSEFRSFYINQSQGGVCSVLSYDKFIVGVRWAPDHEDGKKICLIILDKMKGSAAQKRD